MTDNKTASALPNPFILERADPQITRHVDGRYYFTATVPAYDRIVLRGADTLLGLRDAEETTIWVQHPEGPMGSHIWAPELHWIDGAWYVYFAAGEAESATADVWRIRMYVLENRGPDPLSGEWTEKGQIETPIDSFSLDATTFAHNGTRYLCWAQHDPGLEGSNTSLFLAELANPWTIKGAPVELSRPELPWETIRFAVNEGPYAIVRGGKVFITYSASGTGAEYCMGLLTADADADLLDPASWTKHPEPVFTTNAANGIYGTGHNAFTVDEDGNDLLVFHARAYEEIVGDPLDNPDRHCRVQPFGWNEDGTPDFGEPLPEH
ncbi:glycoside hydrolase family 43 protein [Glycomyces tritici]|uniref:Glycoside hydrolase family 43 protein n=1 Tax=Glycomyces tritici TaxID=2665176 RepID=A0ABT7YY58_9ACTN|nr:glycoside hydrolase family 43 protein [Glycomyces tritici]MDN3243555.1 glycoside hydrolase family 43 protein [Glycomyces tritici]